MIFERSSERGPSVRFQFEVLTLCVCAFQFFIFYHLLGNPHLISITVLNAVPWGAGLWQWKQVARKNKTQEGSSGNSAQQAIVLVLWATYFALMNIEYLCEFR